MSQLPPMQKRLLKFATHLLNPVVLRIAGARYSPFALIRHVGRRSSKAYQTPLIIQRVPGGFILALTYGSGTDWYRNLVAAQGGAVRWHGKDYQLQQPELIDRATGIAAFPLPARPILTLNKIGQFARVRARPR
jgi:deazaflavin-dependent oxidoreductase (nitroreductase family)